MKLLFPSENRTHNRLQSQLLTLSAVFLFLYSLSLTLSPAVRVHSWEADYRLWHWLGYAVWLVGFAWLSREVSRRLPNHDPYLLPVSALLSGWGLLVIYRLDYTLGLRQTLWLLVSVGIVGALLRFPNMLSWLRRYKTIWLTIGLLITGMTLLFGTYPNGEGPHLWFDIFGIYFQPSEPLKLLLIIYLAAYLGGRIPTVVPLSHLIAPTVAITAVAAAILVTQRDLGTATLLITIYTMVIFLATGKRRLLLFSLVGVLAALIIGTSVFEVIELRVDAWLNPWSDPSGRTYQIAQSLISTATGRIFGTGPGLGSPALVPVAHSDFIAVAMAEETGLMGLIGVLVSIGLFSIRGLLITLQSPSTYRRLLAGGISIAYAVQSIMIIGGNLRLFPLTGVTLPFVSYGGSSLVTSYIALGLLLILSCQEQTTFISSVQLRPVKISAGLILTGLALLGILSAWWMVVQSDALQYRPENLRWSINQRFVARGRLLDRRNEPIVENTGEAGNFSRLLLYPSLGTTVGYSNPRFGKAGLEASLDDYLTGLRGNPQSRIFLAQWIYAQSPPGLDVRLSLDLEVQSKLDQALQGTISSAVLINASNGEILALASHPSYDPNQMDDLWETWQADPQAPLLNRATQGQYPPGTALSPFLYVAAREAGLLSSTSPALKSRANECALQLEYPTTLEKAVSAGCTWAAQQLAAVLDNSKLTEIYRDLGFFTAPEFPLPTASLPQETSSENPILAINGEGNLLVSPLQMALAASVLSNGGDLPSPRLAITVLTPHQGSVVLPTDLPIPVDWAQDLLNDLRALGAEDLPIWRTVSRTRVGQSVVTWYVGGTLPNWGGTPLAVSVLIEADNPNLALEVGDQLLASALHPSTP